MRTVCFEKLRPDEILAEQNRCSIAYLPIGPLEWHGPAMPFGTDPLAAGEAARRAALETGGVVLPTLYFGTERERTPQLLCDAGFDDTTQYIVGMDVPNNSMKSFYTPEDIFGVLVREYLRLLTRQGYKLIVIINGHGATGQIATLDRLCVEFSNETSSHVINIMGIAPFDENDEDLGHATRLETSIQMYLDADNVDLAMLPSRNIKLKSSDWGIMDGYTFAGRPPEDKCVAFDPRDANAEIGRLYVEATVRMIVQKVRTAYSEFQK